MIVDRGHDLPTDMHVALTNYGEQMWLFRNRDDGLTTRSLTSYRGEQRQLVWLTCEYFRYYYFQYHPDSNI